MSILRLTFRKTLKATLIASRAMLCIMFFAWARCADAQAITDSLEGSTLDSGWVVVQQQAGTVSLSPQQNHTVGGGQSLKLASSNGNQRWIIVKRYLGASTKGTASIAFYDAAPGQETLYTSFMLINSAANVTAFMGTQDFDAFCYKAAIGVNPAGVNVGPNANCGTYPQSSTTSVTRTAGWHVFSIAVGTQSVAFSIDDTVVYTHPGDFSFDTIQLDVSGPVWRPNTVAYFDDFIYTPLASCETRLSKAIYVNGDTVAVPVFRFNNFASAETAVEIQSWLAVPGAAPFSIISTGADGSVKLPPGANINVGPLNLFSVDQGLPRGAYELGCRLLNPRTGATLSTSQNPFVVQ